LKGATNILLGEVDHRKTACGPRAFAEIYKFIVGRAPARIAITPETEVVLNGRVTGVVSTARRPTVRSKAGGWRPIASPPRPASGREPRRIRRQPAPAAPGGRHPVACSLEF
jgi:hypothetical protein